MTIKANTAKPARSGGMAKSDGKPLLDDLTILRLRLANASERERFREVGDGKVVLFLIGLDPE